MNEKIMTAEMTAEDGLIVVKQLPVIEAQLQSIKESFQAEVKSALALECTEDTLATVKMTRANMTKFYNAVNAKRLEAKRIAMEPIEHFDAVFAECIKNAYEEANETLGKKIHSVEDGIKAAKREEAQRYFDEYRESKGIDFVTFERTGINITMSASKKGIHDQIKTFLDRVADELSMIETQEHREEILIEYKMSLNAASAITIVSNRHKLIEAERENAERARQREQQTTASAEKAESVIETFSPPTIEPNEPKAEVPEKRYAVSFRVVGTLAQIKALKQFLTEGAYEYDQQ